jgi:peptidoglycan/LPS O-acetylase OafA/YrhL
MIKYRPDIDGLRAIAILLVLVFHFFPQFCPGGFVGVDVFFVISGFLITGIIADKITVSAFSFRDFYFRRIRRLFPALILVFLTVLIWGWYNLVDREFSTLGKHLLGGIFFVYNFIAKKESGYFGGEVGYKLLHHIWSLAVEEQFYLFFPVILIGARRLGVSLYKTLVVLVICSFALNVTQIAHVPTNVFYFPEYRLWELGMGGLLALRAPTINARWAHLPLALISLIAILAVSFILNESSLFPGYWALVPVMGTFFIILCSRGTLVGTMLSGNIITYIGRISYPLYLWHWPLYSMSNYWKMQALPGIGIGLLVLSLVLAILTYELVEKKVNAFRGLSKVVGLCIALMALIGIAAWTAFSGSLSTKHAVETRSISEAMASYDQPEASMKFNGFALNHIEGKGPLARENVLILGDSLAYQYYPRFESAIPASASSRNLYMLSGGGCPPIPGLRLAGDNYCGYISFVEDFVRSKNVQYVMIIARWQEYFSAGNKYHFEGGEPASTERSESSLVGMTNALSKLGAVVIFIQSNPIGEPLNPRSMIQRNWNGLSVKAQSMSLAEVQNSNRLSRRMIESVANQTHSLCLDPIRVLCQNGICPSQESSGNPLYRDEAHLNPHYVRELSYLDFVFFAEKPSVDPAVQCGDQ